MIEGGDGASGISDEARRTVRGRCTALHGVMSWEILRTFEEGLERAGKGGRGCNGLKLRGAGHARCRKEGWWADESVRASCALRPSVNGERRTSAGSIQPALIASKRRCPASLHRPFCSSCPAPFSHPVTATALLPVHLSLSLSSQPSLLLLLSSSSPSA